MSATKLFSYGRTTAAERGEITNYAKTWPEIVELFREPVRRKITAAQYQAMNPKGRAHSKNTGLFFGGRCNNGLRRDSTLVSRSIVNLDLDDHCDAIWDEFSLIGSLPALGGLAYLLHTTRSHTDAAPKLRILVPLAREVSPAEYEPVARALAQMLDADMHAVARESYTPAQGMYLPSVSSDQEYHFAAEDGAFFDPGVALAKYPADDASTWPKRVKEVTSEYVAGRRMTHPEEKKAQAPIITAVHRAFHPCDFIEEFLSDTYIPSGDRYYPVGATGAPSVRIYDDAFIQSDHGSDPAVGQHNTFDLGRIHLFRPLDEDYDTASLSPADWPSYKAMVEFMLQREEVRSALAEVEAEVAAERNESMVSMLDSLDDEDAAGDDLVGGAEDAEDDLIGAPVEKKAPSIEDVLRRVRASIAKAKSLNDLERRLDIIRAFPLSDFRHLHRDLVAVDVQKAFKELAGEKITKAEARKMLAPTVENLRDQMAGEPLPAWLKDWVYITSANNFLNLDTKEVLSKEGFNGRYNREAGDQFGSNDMGVTKLTAFDAATQVFCIPMPYTTRFHPGKPSMFVDEGVAYANTYKSVLVETGGYKGNAGVKLLRRLLADMFPNPAHQAMALDFFAHCVKHPDRKLKYALLIKGSENEGKSLLAKMMRKLLGRRNFAIVGPDQLKEKFNGWSYEKLFCVVEEIKIGGREAHEVLNKVKTTITNDEIAVRRMQKDATTEANFCNMYLTTNYEDCLPLEEDNSRYLVLFTRFRTNQEVKDWRAARIKAEGTDYVRDLWDHIEERPHQFLEFFMGYEFSEHYYIEGGRAPDTEFKRQMAEDGKTDERLLLEQMLDDEADPSITGRMLLWSSFRAELDRRGIGTHLKGRGVSSFLKPMGFVKARETVLMIDGKKRKVQAWTKDTSLLCDGDKLTGDGLELARAALTEHEDLDDLESLADNVVRMRR
jgi:hypothetical protein